MYWLITDETNVEAAQGPFFIYGGLIFTPEQMIGADQMVKEIRQKYGYQPTDSLKFQTKARPAQVPVEDSTLAKGEAIAHLHSLGVKMMAYVVHHGIAASQAPETRMEYAINVLATTFDKKFLAVHDDHGVMCIDRVDGQDGYAHLRKRFQQPVVLPDLRTTSLDRIIHYSMSSDGASHMSSLVDISLGAFRYAVNTAMGKGAEAVAKSMFPGVAKLLWTQTRGEKEYAGGFGFLAYPKKVKAEGYAADYETLRKTLTKYIAEFEEPEEDASSPGA